MILWLDGAHDPAENMGRDAALLAAAESGAEPVMRLFQFAPHGITLGASQSPERELDLAGCAAEGIPWAVRPTGGRAIFHAEEWTYAFAAAIDDPDWGGTRAVTYARLARWIVGSLRRLGVPATIGRQEGRDPLGPPRQRGGPAAPCFASAIRDEIALEGRKLVGSAQRRTRAAWLQQGSLLLGEGHLRLVDHLAVPSSRRPALREQLRATTCPAGRWLGTDAPLARWGEALAAEASSRARRLEGPAGAFLLTLGNRDSYTAAVS